MRHRVIILTCILTFLACNKNEDDVLAGDDTVFFLHDLGKGITDRLMATKHTYDSIHDPYRDTAATTVFFIKDSITPTEIISPKRKKFLDSVVQSAALAESASAPSRYYDYYNSKTGNHSHKLVKLVTTVTTDTTYSMHRYAYTQDDHVLADTTIAWNTLVASIDTSVTYYY